MRENDSGISARRKRYEPCAKSWMSLATGTGGQMAGGPTDVLFTNDGNYIWRFDPMNG